jgi:uncharacterized delta-60 repeat protein
VLKPRRIVISLALIVVAACGALIWHLNPRGPSAVSLPHVAEGETPHPSVTLVLPGVLSVALEGRNTSPDGLALSGDGTIVIGATMLPRPVGAAGNNARPVFLRLTADGRPANPAVTLLGTAGSLAGLAPAREGTIVAAGFGDTVIARRFLVVRLRSDGVLDPDFGGGAVLAGLRASLWQGAAARAVAVQRDGRVVVTGSAGFASGPFGHGSYCATARFNRDGRLDRSFGDSGRVLSLIDGRNCGATAVLVASNQKILVVGSTGAPSTVLFRYLPDGTSDRRFGRDGVAEFFDATGWGAALDAQDRVVVVGTKWQSRTDTQFVIARYDRDGNLDQSFGASGAVFLHQVPVSQQLWAAAVQPDGKIVAVGTFGWHSRGRPAKPGERNQIVIVRMDANGALDRAFAGGGFLLMASPRYLWGGSAVVMQPDGKLLILGSLVDEASDDAEGVVLVRLNPDGTPDTNFGAQ